MNRWVVSPNIVIVYGCGALSMLVFMDNFVRPRINVGTGLVVVDGKFKRRWWIRKPK